MTYLNFNKNKMAMIKKLFLTNLMLFVLYSGAVYSQTNRVTKDDALRIAKQHFSGRDVDYYLLSKSQELIYTKPYGQN